MICIFEHPSLALQACEPGSAADSDGKSRHDPAAVVLAVAGMSGRGRLGRTCPGRSAGFRGLGRVRGEERLGIGQNPGKGAEVADMAEVVVFAHFDHISIDDKRADAFKVVGMAIVAIAGTAVIGKTCNLSKPIENRLAVRITAPTVKRIAAVAANAHPIAAVAVTQMIR